MAKIQAIGLADQSQYAYYLEKLGLNGYVGLSAVDDNNQSSQNIEDMLEKLDISANKYYIMRLMNTTNLVSLLYLLNKNQMVAAMDFFPKVMLIRFLQMLRLPQLLPLLLKAMPLKELLQSFPPSVLFNVLQAPQLQASDLLKHLKEMPTEFLQKMMQAITEKDCHTMQYKDLIGGLGQMSKPQMLDGMQRMPSKDMFPFLMAVTKDDPKVLEMLPKDQFLQSIAMLMTKPMIETMFQGLPEDTLVFFLSQLPDQMLAMATAQMDDSTFGQILANQYPSLVMYLAQAA